MHDLFYSEEQYREYQDELMYSPREAYNEEMARLAAQEIEAENRQDEYAAREEQGPQERTATWTQEGHRIYVRYPCGSCIELPRYNPCQPFPKLGQVEIDDQVPF